MARKTNAELQREIRMLKQEVELEKDLVREERRKGQVALAAEQKMVATQQERLKELQGRLDCIDSMEFFIDEDGEPMMGIYDLEECEIHRFMMNDFECAKLVGALTQYCNARTEVV